MTDEARPIDERLTETHAVLKPALEGFSHTLEMPEIAEAQALLAAIEVRTNPARSSA
jgi:hypothetical protein